MPVEFKPVKGDPILVEMGVHLDTYLFDYVQIFADLAVAREKGDELTELNIVRTFAPRDLFFFMFYVLDLPVNDPFILARIRDAQDENDMTIDLWSRKHWKSTILTYALPIWELINDPETRHGIFSITRGIAKVHLRRIKETLEKNVLLKKAWPKIFYDKPDRQSPKWSEDDGLYVKRKKIYLEPSIMACGLDNLPTGLGFTHLIFDDIIDLGNVSTLTQIDKATRFFEMALALKARKHKKRVIGTRYDLKDTYSEIMKKPGWKVRLYPAEIDTDGRGKRGGMPVYLTREELEDYYAQMGEYVYLSQMLQHPVAESQQKFKRGWLKYYTADTRKPDMNYYILVDPATKKRKRSDYTVMVVIGTDYLRNFWILDMIRDKLSLDERWQKLSGLVVSWGVTDVGYEQYGMQADVEFMERMMIEEGLYFSITPLGGQLSKEDRIRRLIPDFQKGRWIIPQNLVYTDVTGNLRELIAEFLDEEFDTFPFGKHDDILDDMARIYDPDMHVSFPKDSKPPEERKPLYDPLDLLKKTRRTTWMAAG